MNSIKTMVCRGEKATICKHAVKNTHQIECALEKYLDDECGYRKAFFITAPTGAGKTTLVEKTVFPRAAKETRILYVSSRTAINIQLKRRILKAPYFAGVAEHYTDKGLMENEVFGNITILTFAGLYRKMISGGFSKNSFDIVCFDEPQALYSDALFCSYTGFLLEHLRSFVAGCKTIFLTATPDNILPLLADHLSDFQILFYRIKTVYDYVNLHLFQNENCIISEINADKSENKWLIFDPSIQHGLKIRQSISGEVCMLNTLEREKDPELWMQICRDEKFQEKVCISTAVVDAGVNFKDEKLKNVVIFGHDKTQIQQVLGRKRRKAGEKVNLYLNCPNEKDLYLLIQNIDDQLAAIKLFDDNYSAFVERHIITPEKLDLRRFVQVDNQGQLKMNRLAKLNLEDQKQLYMKLLERVTKHGETAYEEYIARILQISLSAAQDLWLDCQYNGEAAREFTDFLNSSLDHEMDEETAQAFWREFQKKCVAAYGRSGPKDREGRVWKTRKVNNKLMELGLKYYIEKTENGVVLRAGVSKRNEEADENEG